MNTTSAGGWERTFDSALHVLEDTATGLQGVVAIDSRVLGPAVGGCRLWRYDSTADLHADAVRLARGMTFKNAMAGLPLGGGKAVLQLPAGSFDRSALFAAFGRAVEALHGQYVTAEDVGTSVADMQDVRRATSFVAGLNQEAGPGEGGGVGQRAGGDPSPWTARGVFQAMSVAADSLGANISSLRVAVQGAGNVGARLCKLLVDAGAHVFVSDVDRARCDAVARLDCVTIVSPDEIARIDADVYAPCALGGALNEATITHMKSTLVCGGANNQVAAGAVLDQMLAHGITYVPDYVANAGGIINVAAEYLNETTGQVIERVDEIGPRVRLILARADAENRSPAAIADEMVSEMLAKRQRTAA